MIIKKCYFCISLCFVITHLFILPQLYLAQESTGNFAFNPTIENTIKRNRGLRSSKKKTMAAKASFYRTMAQGIIQ